MLSFKPTFSLSSFTFIKRLFSSSSLSAIRVVSSAYLRLLIILPAILIPACASSSPTFLMMYSAYKLNKQGHNTQPLPTPFPIWNQSVVPCPVLTVASQPAYRFLKRQVRWSGIPISFRIFHSLLSWHNLAVAERPRLWAQGLDRSTPLLKGQSRAVFPSSRVSAASPRARTLNSGRLAQPCFWHFGGQRALDHLLGWEREGSTNCTLET